MVTPLTTRLTVPAAFGLSGVSPRDNERSSAIDCANTANGRHSSRSDKSNPSFVAIHPNQKFVYSVSEVRR